MSSLVSRWVSQLSVVSLALLVSFSISGCQKSSSTAESEPDQTEETPTSSSDESVTVNEETPVAPKETTIPAAKPMPGPAKPPKEEPSGPVAELGIGDPAPAIAISQWATGEPIAALEDGHVYVVEFWATWCPPCRTSMPHLSELQKKYGDKATFIGVTREDLETVEGFLEKEQSEGKTWREVVEYRLALDNEDVTNTAYMKAANQSGIPSAFIIGRDKRIEWIGHPMQMDAPLAKIVSGDWDRDAAIAEFKQGQALKAMARTMNVLLRGEKWDEALALLDKTEAASGKSAALQSYRLFILSRAGRTDEVAALEKEMVEQVWDNANALNEIAWGIVSQDREKPDLDLALKAAQRACELQKNENPSTIDTLARVYFEQGDLKNAIEWQTKAVKLNDGANASIDAALKEYEAALKKDEPAVKDEPAAEEEESAPETEKKE